MIKTTLIIMLLIAFTGCAKKNQVCSSDGYLYEVTDTSVKLLRDGNKFVICNTIRF